MPPKPTKKAKPTPGDVVTVDFPGVRGLKRRPAVVVSTDLYHSHRHHRHTDQPDRRCHGPYRLHSAGLGSSRLTTALGLPRLSGNYPSGQCEGYWSLGGSRLAGSPGATEAGPSCFLTAERCSHSLEKAVAPNRGRGHYGSTCSAATSSPENVHAVWLSTVSVIFRT